MADKSQQEVIVGPLCLFEILRIGDVIQQRRMLHFDHIHLLKNAGKTTSVYPAALTIPSLIARSIRSHPYLVVHLDVVKDVSHELPEVPQWHALGPSPPGCLHKVESAMHTSSKTLAAQPRDDLLATDESDLAIKDRTS